MDIKGGQIESGSIIAGYRIDNVISRGGMGVVYRATNVALHKVYALKTLAPELTDDPQFQERFKREMRLAASIQHPHVVGIHYAGDHDGTLFLVMDFIYGTDLRHLLVESGALDPERAVDLLGQFSSALDAAHEKGLVHRDVKPANMLVTVRDGQEHGYLTDFGVAKHAESIASLTATGAVLGTVHYMAPEQVKGDPTDARTDIYAMGCVFFQMLTGKLPYERDNSIATLFAHVYDPPPALPEELAGLYPTFGGVIEKAMAKDPAERYLSAGDLARDAACALSGARYTGPATIVATGDARPRWFTDAAREPQPFEVQPAPPESPERGIAAAASTGSGIGPAASTGSDITVQPPTGGEITPAPPTGSSTRSEITPAPPTGSGTSTGSGVTLPTPTGASPPTGTGPTPGATGATSAADEPQALAERKSTHVSGTPPGGEGPPDHGSGWGRRRWAVLGGVALLAAVIAVVVVLASGGSSPKPAGAGSAGAGFVSNARPVPTNRVTGTGRATVRLQGNDAIVTVDTNGLLQAAHLMHIHGGTGNCPPASAAVTYDGHRFISASVGDKYYGSVVTSLTQHGDTSPASHLSSTLYPKVGNIRYQRTIPLEPGVAQDIRNGLAVIVVHGIDYDGQGTYTNYLGAGVEASAPALCGPLFPAQSLTSERPGRGGTTFVASLKLYGPTPQQQKFAAQFWCHPSATTAAATAATNAAAESRKRSAS